MGKCLPAAALLFLMIFVSLSGILNHWMYKLSDLDREHLIKQTTPAHSKDTLSDKLPGNCRETEIGIYMYTVMY